MRGKVIDKNLTEAFIALENGETMDVSITRLPKDVKLGDTVDLPMNNPTITNDRIIDFF
ncbi:MAG: hypothetical protein GX370_08600 [Clostridia bacterium]|jgi:hypothetical protein|nr:hypothetical protein [Clostridia bacterium]